MASFWLPFVGFLFRNAEKSNENFLQTTGWIADSASFMQFTTRRNDSYFLPNRNMNSYRARFHLLQSKTPHLLRLFDKKQSLATGAAPRVEPHLDSSDAER